MSRVLNIAGAALVILVVTALLPPTIMYVAVYAAITGTFKVLAEYTRFLRAIIKG